MAEVKKAPIYLRDGKIEYVKVYNVFNADLSNLSKISISTTQRKRTEYIETFGAFDIETTTIANVDNPFAYMYIWMFCVTDDEVIIGRTWCEFRHLLNKFREYFELSTDKRMVVYVHNLAYEYQFMQNYIGEHDLFASQTRKPIKVHCDGIEFRCSYKLTNMSLDSAIKNELGCKYQKAVGDLDYSIIRTPETRLTDKELSYCLLDVLGLHDLIYNRLKNEKDTIHSIPITSTGYVRRDTKKACKADKNYRKMIKKLALTKDVYIALKQAGRGGNTHANRHYSAKIHSKCESYDFVSDYPAQLIYRKYPMTAFTSYGDIEDIEEITELINKYACLFTLELTNVRVRDEIAMPYISQSKLLSLQSDPDSDYMTILDNGRIVQCGYCKMVITDLDFAIIEKQYEFDGIAFTDVYIAEYDYLPTPIIETVKKYFVAKCELKRDIKAIEKIEDSRELTAEENQQLIELNYLYGKSKNRLNAIFGMMYTDPVHDEIICNNGEWSVEEPDIDEAIAQVNKSENTFLYYAWGVWCTAWARYQLEQLQDAVGYHNVIYCDTDSVKCFKLDEFRQEEVNKFNKEIEDLALNAGAYCDVDGKRYILGVAEYDGNYDRFITLGAKKYACEDSHGLHVTVSGVSSKRDGAGNLIKCLELEKLENFKPGFIWREAGGIELKYNDDNEFHNTTIDGCIIKYSSNVAMLQSTYKLGITIDYMDLLAEYENY